MRTIYITFIKTYVFFVLLENIEHKQYMNRHESKQQENVARVNDREDKGTITACDNGDATANLLQLIFYIN